ncbi:hypothetical protein FK220_005405 [Flavobacteriaceae bacterium TP-CH-4]|uniref:Cytochrome oxidase complex assembly protein 1 n=1 Tax=Pelagihabitans pacificus TaxID=2696054 RepID=A0A967AY87_9FLAO|nr:cytochrome c oxidase assembly factor Coa1 family protein [Pelagihabitans pacificus]NHF58766.1 hypothetical protein [Pelagihabitans pacificus]
MNNELVPRPNWWKRNWKWALPIGGCLTMAILIAVFIGSVFYGITSVFEGSDPYEYALEKVNEDERLIRLLGSPIAKDGMIQGNLSYRNGNGKADMGIPISGPNGDGILYIKASSVGDDWTYHEIRVELSGNESIDLLKEASVQF